MKNWIITLIAVASTVLFSGCDYDEPDFTNVRDIHVLGFEDNQLHAEFTVDCDNPNGFGFKVKRSLLNIYIADSQIGTVELDDKIKIKRKSLRTYTVPVAIRISPLGMLGLMKSIKSDQIELRLEGTVRGSVWGFSKSFPVNEKRTIDGSMLKELGGIFSNSGE